MVYQFYMSQNDSSLNILSNPVGHLFLIQWEGNTVHHYLWWSHKILSSKLLFTFDSLWMKFDISGWLESSEFCWKTESISTVLIETIGDVIGAMKRQSEVSLLVATAVQRVTEWNCCYIIVFRCCCCCIIVRWCWCIIACWCCYCITIITCVSIVFSSCKIYISYFQPFKIRVQQLVYL